MPNEPVTPVSLPPESLVGGIRPDQEALLNRLAAMRRVRNAAPGPLEPGLSDRELARQLVYDAINALTRNDIVMQHAATVIDAHTHELRRANDLRAEELRAETLANERSGFARAAEVEQRNRVWKATEHLVSLAGMILGDSRVRTGVIVVITNFLTALAGWAALHFGGGG